MKPHFPLIKRGGKNNSENKKRPGVDYQRIGLAVLTVVVLSVLLFFVYLLPSKVTLKLGDVAPEDIIARRTRQYIDKTETELRIREAEESVRTEYDPVPNAENQAVGAMRTVFRIVEEVRNDRKGTSLNAKIRQVRDKLGTFFGSNISNETLGLLISTDWEGLREIEDYSLRVVSAAMSRDIHDDKASLRIAQNSVMEDARKLIQDKQVAKAVGEIARDSIRPNLVENEARTLAKKNEARENVKPVYRLIVPGEKVIAKGERVLQEHLDKFEALGLRNPSLDYRAIISLTLFVIGAVTLVSLMLWRYYPNVYWNTKSLWLLSLIIILSTLFLRVGGSLLGLQLNSAQVGYLGILWIVTASMLISVLLNPQIAVIIAAMFSIVLSMMLNNELRHGASAMMMALMGIYSVANIRDRNDLMRAAGLLAITGLFLVWVFGGISGDSVQEMAIGSVWISIMSGIAALLLFPLGTWLLEKPFEKTTHMSLLELADTNKKLLRQMLMEAPGTYTHSMAVGHLAETAAEAIGADSLVARVASYYHDIGKIRRPHFFIENQNIENVHDRMNPTLSALVITSHIKDGMEVAKEHKLPKVVTDIILQHHGTSLVQYFYSQAAGEQDPSTALEQQFRYQGPKPQSKEAAIVMLADSVEAASRTLDKPTPAKIELMVNRIIADKLRDGQLDECDLTFREVSKISASFVRTLIGTMHARIEYPDIPNPEGRKISDNGDSNSELAENSDKNSADAKPGPAAAAS